MSSISEDAEDQLYNQLKDLPDFRSFPLPSRWFKKYNIPPIEPGSTKEFLESRYSINCMFAPKDLDPIIINEPQKDASGNIIVIKMIEEEPIDVKVVSRPYDPNVPPLSLEDLLSNTNDQCFQSSEVPSEPHSEPSETEHQQQ